jgi:hypothetical protein
VPHIGLLLVLCVLKKTLVFFDYFSCQGLDNLSMLNDEKPLAMSLPLLCVIHCQ